MATKSQIWCLLSMSLVAVAVDGRMMAQEGGSACGSLNVKKMKSLTPPLTAKPGEVNNKWFPAEFPKGHIGIKRFRAELVDHNRAPVPLSEIYLHHWIMVEFGVPKQQSQMHLGHLLTHMRTHHKPMPYDSSDYFGAFPFPSSFKRVQFLTKGGEARHTEMSLPEPYVVESGKEIDGQETMWMLNVHALDTRGAVDRMGCAECRCNLYNATTDEDGEPLPEGYVGGLRCCGDGQQCAVEEGYNGEERTFHLEYTWEYFDWNDCLIPTQNFAIDITKHDDFGENKLEFTVEGCGDADPSSEECVDTRVAIVTSPVEGKLVRSVSHLHAGAIDSSIWGEDGRLLCRSTPMYGQGEEAGNEKHYVVGITACYPDAMRVKQGEKLNYVVKYSKVGGPHTGLMGVGNLWIAADGVKAAF